MYYYSKNDDLGNFKAEKYKIEIEVNILNTTLPLIELFKSKYIKSKTRCRGQTHMCPTL